MNAIKYMDELEQKGFTKEQAKTSINLWIELMNQNLASKNDLLEVQSELKNEIKDLNHKMDNEFLSVRHEMKEIRHEMKEMESRLTIKLGSFMAAGLVIMGLLQKL